ncbi:hypothetical protein KBD49_09560 [Myxococcota bacterium]|jgi:hypothetical protein|nr:hypothetical protein [Myxococcota bacterium]
MTVQRGFQTSFGGFRGQLELWVADSSGLVLEHWLRPNLVVNAGRAFLAGEIATRINRFGIGTNGAAAEPGDVAPLEEQVLGEFTAVEFPDPRSVLFRFEVGTAVFNGQTIREFGLLAVEDEKQILFARKGGFEIPKTNQVQVLGAWTITF